MINNITVTNHLGESITLELRSPEKSGFFVRDGTKGFDPPKADVNTTEILSSDGSDFNSSRLNSRNILLKLGFLECPTIEDARHKCYKFFPVKKQIKIAVETDRRTSYIYGYVEANEIDIFSEEEGADISIICTFPYFTASQKNTTILSGIEPGFEFPFSNESLTENLIIFGNIISVAEKKIINSGDDSVGVIIYIHAIGGASNIQITNERTQVAMRIDSERLIALTGSDIIDGDDIVISTVKGAKSITLFRSGVSYNILNTLGKNPDWIQLEEGENLLAFTASRGIGELLFTTENDILYEGV